MIIDVNGNAFLGRRRSGIIIMSPKPVASGPSALLQHAVSAAGTTVAPPGATTVGSLIVVPIVLTINTTCTGVTDNVGNTYVQATGAYKNATDGGGAATDIWYCASNISTGVTLITAAISGGGGAGSYPFFQEYSNPVSGVFDTANGAWSSGNSTTVSSGTITTTHPKDIIVAIGTNPASGTPLTSPGGVSGFAETDNLFTVVSAGYAIVSSTGTYTPTWQQTPAGEGMGSTAAFKAN